MPIGRLVPSFLRLDREDKTVAKRESKEPRVRPMGRRTGLRLEAASGGLSMLSQAVEAMLQRLEDFLPGTGAPSPTVSLISVQEQPVGLGEQRGLGLRGGFPVVLTGIRAAAAVRFQIWGGQPETLEAAVVDLTEQLLAEKDVLFKEGFLSIELKNVSVSEFVASLGAWRQIAEFELLYEFQAETSDDTGGLIANIPIALRESWGSALVTGDLVIWDADQAPGLKLNGGRVLDGLSVLGFTPGADPAGTVTVLRSHDGAAGAPTAFPSLDDFLAAVAGPDAAERHAEVVFANLSAFLTEVGAEQDVIQFVDESGTPRGFVPRSRAFDQPVELSGSDYLEVVFSGSSLGTDQILYLRGIRGSSSL